MNLSFCSGKKRVLSRLGAPLLTVLLLLVGSQGARAATFTVTTAYDLSEGSFGCTSGGRCSLRDAISAANATGDKDTTNTIVFDAKAFAVKREILIKRGDLPPITSNLIINGPTATGAGITLRPRGYFRGYGFALVDGRARISNLTFVDFDRAIDAQGGHSLVENCAFYANYSALSIRSKRPGTLTAQNCTMFFNIIGLESTNSPDSELGLYNPATLQSCTLAGNDVGIANSDRVAVANSIVAANEFLDVIGDVDDGGHNIIEGDPFELGLDFKGLNDNGGPTPTLALLNYSPAIGAGATSLPTDQRGIKRDKAPDIGAFEYINVAPTIDEVTPQNASDKVGQQRVFTVKISDANGLFDLSSLELLINDEFNTSSGALVKIDLFNKLLYLKKNNEFLPPIHIGLFAGSKDVVDNGAVQIRGSQVNLDREFFHNDFTLSLAVTVGSGLIGTNTLFVRVEDATGATATPAKAGEQGFVRSGTYTVKPSLPNSAPTLSQLSHRVTLTTLGSDGIAPEAQTFGFIVQDKDGPGDIRQMEFSAGQTPAANKGATFVFYPRTRILSLFGDNGVDYTSGVVGTAVTLENSQVSIDLSKVKFIAYGDRISLGLIFPMKAKSGLLGQNRVWLRVQDSSGATSPGGDERGFVPSGSWIVRAGTTSKATPAPGHSAGAS